MPAQILLRELVVQVVAVERLRRFAHGFSTEAPTQRSVVEDRSLRVLVTTEQARVSGKSPIPQDTCSATSRTELAGRKKKKKQKHADELFVRMHSGCNKQRGWVRVVVPSLR